MGDEAEDLVEELLENLNEECIIRDVAWNENNLHLDYENNNLIPISAPCLTASSSFEINGVALCRRCYRIFKLYRRLFRDLCFRSEVLRKLSFLRWDVDDLMKGDKRHIM